MARVLVLNATGKVSSNVIDAVVAAGHTVTAASRNPSEPSTDAVRRVHFDYSDASTWDAALDGVERLFWLSPPMVLNPDELCGPFFDKALPQLDKVVLMTAAGIEHAGDIPLRRVEQKVEQSGTAYSIVRPNWFHDNFHTFWIAGIQQAGVLALPAADAKSAFIDARDIGASAAAALFDSSADGKAFTLTGPESLTYTEAAAILSKAAGREITYQPIDDEPFIQTLIGFGIPEGYARFLDGLFQAVRAGGAAQATDDVKTLLGREPISLATYAAEHVADFAPAEAAPAK